MSTEQQAIAESFQTYYAYNPPLAFEERTKLYAWITSLLYHSTDPKGTCNSCYTESCYVLTMCDCGLSTYCGNCLYYMLSLKVAGKSGDIIHHMQTLCPACKKGHPAEYYEHCIHKDADFLNAIQFYEKTSMNLFRPAMYTFPGLQLDYYTNQGQLTITIGLAANLTNKIKMKTATLTPDVFNVVYYKAAEFYTLYEHQNQCNTTVFEWNRLCQSINRELERNERNVFLNYYLLKVLIQSIQSISPSPFKAK